MSGYKQYYLVEKNSEVDEVTIAKVPDIEPGGNVDAIITQIINTILEMQGDIVKNRVTSEDAKQAALDALSVALSAKKTADAAMEAVGSGGSGGNNQDSSCCCIHKVIDTRYRDPNKPTYGIEDPDADPDNPVQPVLLQIQPYTGTAEVSVIANGNIYDTDMISTNRDGETIPDGMIIIKKLEE